MEDVFKRVVELVKDATIESDDHYVKFSDTNYQAHKFDRKNFNTLKKPEKENKIAFIDGGNAEIVRSANFSLNIIRTYYSIFSGHKKIKSTKKDFYSLTKAKSVNNEISYETEIIGTNEKTVPEKEDLLVSSFDKTITQGINRASVSNVSNLIRRFSELKLACCLVGQLDEGDMIVLDGSLQCTLTNERKYMDKLLGTASEKKVIVTGLSKTTTLMTDKGNSILNVLNNFNVKGKWAYHPVADIKSKDHRAEMAFVKLHDKSKYAFRFEIFKEQKSKLLEVISLLSENSRDSVFVGYPYGLIDADRHARVSNEEKKTMQTYLSVKFGKEWEKIKESLTSTDAHEILDTIS
ncbi:DNA double-strand break repair nuclease NurA [Candidatus Woesearchaeota archaeon]|nr:DNA double-strand break repair nuclease NurA [Candidatus Woesearchaeota archaeon]